MTPEERWAQLERRVRAIVAEAPSDWRPFVAALTELVAEVSDDAALRRRLLGLVAQLLFDLYSSTG
ncbi:MAG: hypothetical protein ACTHU0_39280 [Kofleriaceae bacterium]